MEKNNLRATLEALLFVLSEPISTKRLAEILEVAEESVKEALEALREDFNKEGRGLWLTQMGREVQLTTKPQFAGLLEKVIKSELKEELTSSSLETLSIIAYLGPISRAIVDYIRGVNSSFILRSLLLRGLIQRLEEKRSNAFLYDLSFDFMRHLGISRKEELPEYEKYQELAKILNNETL